MTTQAPERQATCPQGYHTCSVAWTCDHGYRFQRHHAGTGKYETAYEGPDAGTPVCPECTVDYEERENALVAKREVMRSDNYLIGRLNEELGLSEDWRN